MIDEKFVNRFWSKVNKTGDCWLWTASVTTRRGGYGQFKVGRQVLKAHRASWELCNGLIPDAMCVLHRCDVPACVNPEHLFLGTRLDNNADMKAKRRSTIGERNPKAKLSETAARAILEDSRSSREIAGAFDVCQSTVTMIKARKTWIYI